MFQSHSVIRKLIGFNERVDSVFYDACIVVVSIHHYNCTNLLFDALRHNKISVKRSVMFQKKEGKQLCAECNQMF